MKAANSEYHFSQIEFQILISLFWIDFLKPLSVGLRYMCLFINYIFKNFLELVYENKFSYV